MIKTQIRRRSPPGPAWWSTPPRQSRRGAPGASPSPRLPASQRPDTHPLPPPPAPLRFGLSRFTFLRFEDFDPLAWAFGRGNFQHASRGWAKIRRHFLRDVLFPKRPRKKNVSHEIPSISKKKKQFWGGAFEWLGRHWQREATERMVTTRRQSMGMAAAKAKASPKKATAKATPKKKVGPDGLVSARQILFL